MNYLAASERLFPERPGGSGRVTWELLKLMRDGGHRAALVCGSEAVGPRPELSMLEGIEVVRYRYPRLRAWDPRRLEVHVAAAAAAVEVLGASGWDVVHGHNLAPALGAFRAATGRVRRLATCHSPAVLEQRINWRHAPGLAGALKRLVGEPMLRSVERRLYAQADAVSVLSEFTSREMEAIFPGLLAGKTTLIPWWSDALDGTEPTREEARRKLGWPDGPVLYTLRRLVPRMGLDLFLGAVDRLAAGSAFSVVIAGDGPDRMALEARAAASPHASRIRFMGRISDEEVALAYRAADVFVLPTRSLECFGIIALEAMARGLPVIGARVGAIPEVVAPILGDWMFDGGDVAGLARQLERFLGGAAPRPTESELKAYVQDRYSKARVGGAYLRWIEGTR